MKLLDILSTFLGISRFFCSSQLNNEFYYKAALTRIQAGAEFQVLGDVHMYGTVTKLENN